MHADIISCRQCYLKGFSQPRKRGKTYQVIVFDRDGKKFISNILNLAVEHDFNRVEIEDKHSDVFEQALAKLQRLMNQPMPKPSAASKADEEELKKLMDDPDKLQEYIREQLNKP